MQNTKTIKKRELLSGDHTLNSMIQYLVGLSGDLAKLELHDNYEASKRVRISMIRFRNELIPQFESKIKDIRENIKIQNLSKSNSSNNQTTKEK